MKRAALLALCVAFVAACVEQRGIVDYWPPLPEPGPPAGPEELVGALEHYYRERDLDGFAGLLAHDPDNGVVFVFRLAGSVGGESSWGYDVESRIHRRMFTSANVVAGEPAVPPEYWLQAIDISLTQITAWTERPEFYRSDTNPTGLPEERWRVVEARFSTYVFWDTQTDNDFLVEDEAIFTVIEDREKSGAEPGRFRLLQWQDINDVGMWSQSQPTTWTGVKKRYR